MKTVNRNKIRIACYCFASIAIISAYAYREHTKAEYYRREALAFARQASSELALSAEEINLTLTKCALSPSDELTRAMCAKLYGTCLVTAAAMDSLPWQHELEQLTSMLEETELMALHGAQTGDIDLNKLSKIKNDFENTANLLTDAYDSYNGAVVTFDSSVIDPYHGVDEDKSQNFISDINASAKDYAVSEEVPKESIITADEACAKSARIINCKTEDISCNEITNSFGTVYYCSKQPLTIGIDGEGRVVYYRNDSKIGGEGISIQDAIAAATEFSSKIVGNRAELISYRIEDGYLRCAITGSSNDIYDLDTPINVTVDMSDSGIACFDAVEYHNATELRNELYEAFTIENTSVSINLPPEADKDSETMCIIKMPWKEQFICLGYTATNNNGTKYNIYYDAATGTPIDLRIISEQEHELNVR